MRASSASPARGPRAYLESSDGFLPATAMLQPRPQAMLRRLGAPRRERAAAELEALAKSWDARRASWAAGGGRGAGGGLPPGLDEAGALPRCGLPWGSGFDARDAEGRWPALELRRRLRAGAEADRAVLGDGRSLLLIDDGLAAFRACRIDLEGLVRDRSRTAALDAWRWARLMFGEAEGWRRTRLAWRREARRWARRVAGSLRAAVAGFASAERARRRALRALLAAARARESALPAAWRARLDAALAAGGLPLSWTALGRSELAGLALELHAEDGRRSGGVYFTPEALVESVAADLVARSGAERPLRCCDPACGDGRFLIAACDAQVLGAFEDGGGRPLEALAALRARFAAALSGIEKDPATAELAALALEDYAGLRGQIRCGDGLKLGQGGCDLVFGNPPYRAFYARGSRRRHGEDPGAVSGRTNDFLRFLERAESLCGPEGYGALVLPDAILANLSYEARRRSLCARGRLRSVDVFRCGLFPGAQVGTAVISWGPPRPEAEAVVELGGWASLDERRRFPRAIKTTAAELLARPGCRWLPVSRERIRRAFLCPDRSVALGELAHVRDGINPGTRKARDRILSRGDDADPSARPCLAGRDIQPFAVARPELRVRTDPRAISAEARRRGTSLREDWIFDSPRVVYRQTAPRIIAAVVLDGLRALNSVHNIVLREPDEDALFALCAYLNSEVFNEAYALVSGETRWLFPQVHIATLRGMRVPRELLRPGEARSRLATLARRVSTGARGPREETAPAPAPRELAAIEALCRELASAAEARR